MDEYAFNEEVFGIIEPALEEAGYIVLDGDSDTSCVCSYNGSVHFQIKLIHVKSIRNRNGWSGAGHLFAMPRHSISLC